MNTYEVVYAPTLGMIKTIVIEASSWARTGNTYEFSVYVPAVTEMVFDPEFNMKLREEVEPAYYKRTHTVHNVAMVVLREPGTTPLDSNSWDKEEL